MNSGRYLLLLFLLIGAVPPAWGETVVEAGFAQWDLGADRVTLKEGVEIREATLGGVTCFGEMTLSSGADGEGWRYLETRGETHLIFCDCRGHRHLIVSPGITWVDRQERRAVLEGGTQEPLFYADDLGEVLSDRAQVAYAEEGLERVTLQGEVRMRHVAMEKGSQEFVQWARAARVDYLPKESQLQMESVEGQPVLFYDDINHVEISAPAICVSRPNPMGPLAYKGIGDVRLTFVDKSPDEMAVGYGFARRVTHEVAENEP